MLGWFFSYSINFYFGHRQTQSLQNLQEQGALVDDFISEFLDYLSMMKDAETGGRGYTITGVEEYLEPYKEAVAYLNSTETKALFSEAANTFPLLLKAKLEEIEQLQKLKIEELQKVIDTRKTEGFTAAQSIVLSNKGKKAMDDIRDLIAQIVGELKPLRKKIDTEIENTFNRLSVSYAVGGVIYLLFSIAILFRLYRAMQASQKFGRELSSVNQERDFALNAAHIGSWKLDLKTEELIGNDELYEIVAAPRASLSSLSKFLELIHPDDLPKHKEQLQKAIQQKSIFNDTFRVKCPDGKLRFLTSRGCIFFDAENPTEKMLGVVWDVTDRYAMDVQKDEFIAVVSHEMRTPLTSIIGALDLVLGRNLSSEETKELLSAAQRNSHRLIKIVNNIIDVEKAQLGKLELFFKKMKIQEMVLEAIQSQELAAGKAKVQIQIEKPLPDREVKGDYIRLVQVMINLLSNAIKFSPPQGIVRVAITEKPGFVCVSVQDQGPGIPEEFKEKIFHKFSQADASTKRSSEGTGMGLFISKTIIERHGGKIDFTSKVGTGSTFFFELPLYKE